MFYYNANVNTMLINCNNNYTFFSTPPVRIMNPEIILKSAVDISTFNVQYSLFLSGFTMGLHFQPFTKCQYIDYQILNSL
jgi:hypothetical protein